MEVLSDQCVVCIFSIKGVEPFDICRMKSSPLALTAHYDLLITTVTMFTVVL